MDAFTNYVAENPALLTLIVFFVVITILYFIMKKFMKLVLVLLFIILLAGGVYFFKEPDKMPGKVKHSVDMMKSGIDQISDKTKSFYKDTKELFNKGKKVPGDINKLLKDSKEQAGN